MGGRPRPCERAKFAAQGGFGTRRTAPCLSCPDRLGARWCVQGFTVLRIHGSHHVLAKKTLRTTVPVHGNQILRIGTLRGILRDIDLSPSEFTGLWKA
ncbi:MAG TPA: type II toxin-antitoxin system HicA family toxin [Bryobacteraceae bacterium]|nr:type II toxin-antitoxin system HicA family toxin [Bryobacteraceae bacterium]